MEIIEGDYWTNNRFDQNTDMSTVLLNEENFNLCITDIPFFVESKEFRILDEDGNRLGKISKWKDNTYRLFYEDKDLKVDALPFDTLIGAVGYLRNKIKDVKAVCI